MNCSITDFGAKTTDVLQTEIIQKAIDACFLAGGGTVRIPKGIYRTGDIRIRSNVTLYLEKGAILEGSQNPEDYKHIFSDQIEPITQEELDQFVNTNWSANPYTRWSSGLIRAIHAKNIAIIGEEFSWIDGMSCYDDKGEEGYRGPHLIYMYQCENVTFKGYSVRRSSNWAHCILYTKNLTAEDVTVLGGHDAIDIHCCNNVLIRNCYLDAGDDAIAGFNNENVVIRDCLIGTNSNVLRFSGNNVLVENCKSLDEGNFGYRGVLPVELKEKSHSTGANELHRTNSGYLYYCDFRYGRDDIDKPVENIVIRNCEFGELGTPFCLKWDEGYIWCSYRPLKQIKFENCVFKSIREPIYIHGSKEVPMLFEMENCKITVKPGCESIIFLDGIDFGTVQLTNVQLHGFVSPRIVKHTDGSVQMKDGLPIEILEENSPNYRGTFTDPDFMTKDGLKQIVAPYKK